MTGFLCATVIFCVFCFMGGLDFFRKKKFRKINILLLCFLLSLIVFLAGRKTGRPGISFSGFSALGVLVTLKGMIRILTPKTFREKLSAYDIKPSKKIDPEKHIKEGIKNRLGCYIGYNLHSDSPVYLPVKQRLHHVHVLGTTGSGKTTGVLSPLMQDDIRNGMGLISVDAKGDIQNANTIYKMAVEAGREKDFLFFSIAHPERSSTYNPLQHGNPTQLKDKITGAIDWSEPFYQRVCENALQILFMEHGQDPITLQDVYRILQNPSGRYYGFSKFKSHNLKNIMTLESEIGLLVNSTFCRLLDDPEGEIDLLDAYTGKKIVYFALDTQSFGMTAARLGKMITRDLNTISGIVQSRIQESQRNPIGIYVDEYQSFGTKSFVDFLARGRAGGFMITIAHQSIGDLYALGKAYTRQIIQNTNTKIFLQTNEPEAARLFSDILGTYRTIEETHQTSLSGIPAGPLKGTEKVTDEYIIPPQVIRELKKFEAAYKYGSDYGKLVLNPVFPETGEITLPLRPDRQTQDRQPALPVRPEPPKSVL